MSAILVGNSSNNPAVGQLGWKGETGDSAYEIAVKHGYTGTEAQWSDDFLNAENYYDKTEADVLLGTKANATNVYTKTEADNKFVANGNIAIITKTLTVEAATGMIMEYTARGLASYPEGFTQSNCYVIGSSVETPSTGVLDSLPIVYYDADKKVDGIIEYDYRSSGIMLRYVGNVWGTSDSLTFKIVLMKIS